MKTDTFRMEVGGEGAGEFSQTDLDRRAAELARADGRDEAHEGDYEQAQAELTSGRSAADGLETEISEDERVEAGSPVGSRGTQAERFELDDEQAVPERLVEEGVEEAEHESRLRSNDDLDR